MVSDLKLKFFLLRVQFSLMKCHIRKLASENLFHQFLTCFTSSLHHGHVIIIVPIGLESTLDHTYNE